MFDLSARQGETRWSYYIIYGCDYYDCFEIVISIGYRLSEAGGFFQKIRRLLYSTVVSTNRISLEADPLKAKTIMKAPSGVQYLNWH